MISITRASLIAIIAQKFNLSPYETTVLESLSEKYFSQIDKNRLIDRTRQYDESVIFGSLLYMKPETDITKIFDFISTLYEDERDIASRMNIAQKYASDAPIKLGKLTQVTLVNPSKAVILRKLVGQ